MTRITADQVKELREKTGVGMMDCKRALEEACGDAEKAVRILREKGLAIQKKRQERSADQGVIEAYLHIGKQIGSLVELNCETDFVARNEEFTELAHLVALQVAACNPKYLDRESVPFEVADAASAAYREQCEAEGRPRKAHEEIVSGMLEKLFQEICLLEQPFVKDPSISVEELMAQVSGRLGEKLAIRRFERFQIGADQGEE